jgi:SAM domain (Sterile alpha motif)
MFPPLSAISAGTDQESVCQLTPGPGHAGAPGFGVWDIQSHAKSGRRRLAEELGLGQYRALFADQAIDSDVLPDLTDDDLVRLGVPLGHRERLLKAIN